MEITLFISLILLLTTIIDRCLSIESSRVLSIACQRNSSLPYCLNNENIELTSNVITTTTATIAVLSKDDDNAVANAKKTIEICLSLKAEYVDICDKSSPSNNDDDRRFCQVYASTCTDHLLSLIPTTPRFDTNYEKYCAKHKQRYEHICPEPFRFVNQNAIIFCPQYSERCDIPLPSRSISPSNRKNAGQRGYEPYADAIQSTIKRLCNRYRQFATNYCYNPVTLRIPRFRSQCLLFFKFCK